MSSFETTELKLKSTPTGGVSGEHSPYYRRLLSAGYKGFIQGSLGGAGFYGALGLAVGTLIAIPAALLFPPLGLGAFAFVPACGALGVVKGSQTFGNIGTVAAISAESADLSEQRRYLLDRYYELPDGPEGDKQAELIKKELTGLQKTDRKHPIFHWKTVAICAAIGGLLALAIAVAPHVALLEGLAHAFGGTAIEHAVTTLGAMAPAILPAVGAAFGALAGAAIGIDRYYVRKWFDGSEKLLHENSHTTHALDERAQQLDRLREAQKIDNQTKLILERRRGLNTYDLPPVADTVEMPAVTAPAPKQPIASLDAVPDTKVSSATLQNRLADIQQAMQIPAL